MGGDTFCVGEVGASGVLLIVVAAGVLALVSMAAVVVVEVEVAVGEVAALVGRVVMGGAMALMMLEVGVAGVVEVPTVTADVVLGSDVVKEATRPSSNPTADESVYAFSHDSTVV